jgi:hypothetical protein
MAVSRGGTMRVWSKKVGSSLLVVVVSVGANGPANCLPGELASVHTGISLNVKAITIPCASR